jgi:UDP-glucose 4-epimerase
MSRVLPLFIHQMMRGDTVTVFGGSEKVLDFTYIDDCVDGIARGIDALAHGRVANETVNLAYGQGNTLVRAAELIAAALEVEPQIAYASSLLGEVTHYVADIRKARELLEWQPATPLERGIPRAVDWFREWRAEHPFDERHPLVHDRGEEIPHGFKQPAPAA